MSLISGALILTHVLSTPEIWGLGGEVGRKKGQGREEEPPLFPPHLSPVLLRELLNQHFSSFRVPTICRASN